MRKTRESRRAPFPGDALLPRDVWYTRRCVKRKGEWESKEVQEGYIEIPPLPLSNRINPWTQYSALVSTDPVRPGLGAMRRDTTVPLPVTAAAAATIGIRKAQAPIQCREGCSSELDIHQQKKNASRRGRTSGVSRYVR